MIQNLQYKLKIQSWSRATCICCAISGSLLFFRVAMTLFHDTSTPFPASHSLRTSIAMSSGLPRQLSEIAVILFPMSSWRRNVPKTLILGTTRRGSSNSSSCGRVGRGPETGDREHHYHHHYRQLTNYKHLLFKVGLVTAFFLDFFSFFPLPEAAHKKKSMIKKTQKAI